LRAIRLQVPENVRLRGWWPRRSRAALPCCRMRSASSAGLITGHLRWPAGTC